MDKVAHEIDAMSEAQLDAALRQAGVDPAKLVKRVEKKIRISGVVKRRAAASLRRAVSLLTFLLCRLPIRRTYSNPGRFRRPGSS